MGEIQGNLWATMIFVIAFGGLSYMFLNIVGVMEYQGVVSSVEDNIVQGNYNYIYSLGSKFNVCENNPTDTLENCSGIVEVNEENSFVVYQLSYDGSAYQKSADSMADSLVVLPY